MLQEVDSAVHTCFGGYPDAERRIILFLPDWAKENPSVYAPLSYIRASWSEKSGVKIGHRDFFGSFDGRWNSSGNGGRYFTESNEL